MDPPDVAPGAVVYFPGQLCGVAVEIPSTSTVQVDLIKNWRIAWPRLENEKFIMTTGSARPMEGAARIVYRELVRLPGRRLRLRRDRNTPWAHRC
jgi:amidase